MQCGNVKSIFKNYFMILNKKELSFGIAIIFSSLINYIYIALLNSSFNEASEFYLGQAISIVLTSLFSLGLVNSVLKFNRSKNLKLTIYASFISIIFSSFILFFLVSSKAALLPIIIVVDVYFFYFRSIGLSKYFFLAKISYAITPLILFYYFKIDPHYLVLISSIIIIVCFSYKLKLDNFFRNIEIENKQIEYAWPIGLNTLLRTFISYFDQIFFLVILTHLDLSDYTKLIKLSLGFRLAFTLPHVRLLPLYLADFKHKSKLFKLEKFYNYYIILILCLLIISSKFIINIFSINEDFIYLFLVLVISESIRASSSFKQLYYSAINKTINNLFGNIFAFFIVIAFFYPSYINFGLNGLVFIQLISSISLILYHIWKIKKIKRQSVL